MQSALPPKRLLHCLIAALLVTAAVPASAVSASAVPGSAVPSAATPGVQIAFTDAVVSEQRGDVAEIGVQFSEDANATATVRIGDGTNHVATVVVRDADGDGRAQLRFNTYDGTVTASDGDAATVRDRSNVTTPLPPGRYGLELWSGNGTVGEPVNIATLALGDRSTDGFRTWTGLKSVEVSTLHDLNAARKSGNLTRTGTVALNDTLVLELRASGLEGAIAAHEGRNATERFFAFLTRGNASLVVYDVPGPEQERAYLDLTDPSAVTVVPDPRNDSYYLGVDLQTVRVTDGDGGETANNQRLADWHVANFTLSNASALTAGGRETVTTEVRIADSEATLDTPPGTDRAYLARAPNQTISGDTTLAPGHRVTVEVRRTGDEVRSKTVRVRNGTESVGRFAATFDLGGLRERTDYAVWVGHEGRPLLDAYRSDSAEVPATVTALDASVNLTDRGLTAQGVVVEHARLSHGGYLAVHRGSPDGEVLARSQRLAPGESFGQFVDLDSPLESNATLVVVAHRARAGETLGDPYTENGTPIADSVRFTVERTTTTTATTAGTEPTTATATATASATATTTATSPAERETTSTIVDPATKTSATTASEPERPVPGFGAGAALVALLAVGLLAHRKKRGR